MIAYPLIVIRGNGMADQETFPCRICGEQKKKSELVPAGSIPESIAEVIRKEYPAWSPGRDTFAVVT